MSEEKLCFVTECVSQQPRYTDIGCMTDFWFYFSWLLWSSGKLDQRICFRIVNRTPGIEMDSESLLGNS